MNDIEKVIKTFDAQIAVAKEIRSDFVQLTVGEAKTALELLKEQKTTKPTVSIDTWICSKCGHTLESQELIDDKENPQVLIHEQYEYCPCCGRKVIWDE